MSKSDKGVLTVAGLGEQLHQLIEEGFGERKVRMIIQKGRPSLGSSPSVDIVGVNLGFDWNSKSLFLEPSAPVGVAGEALDRLGRDLQLAEELVYRVEHTWEDKKLSDAQKLHAIGLLLERHLKRRKTDRPQSTEVTKESETE